MRIINHAYPQQQQQYLQQQQQHHPPQLAAPPHHPSPLPTIDDNTAEDDNASIEHHHAMSHNHTTHDDRRGVPHDHAGRSSYSNSPATLSHHERPSVDPTTLRSLLNDWRVDQPHHTQLRNGERDHRDSQPSSSKRKLEEPHEELQSKIRRIVRDHLTMDYTRATAMTTVICLHAAVAQKSYGSEKRFLCPPPVVRIETPHAELKNQHLAMGIVTESGERGPEQRSPLDNNMVANFKYLHVSGTAKSKSFQLALDIAESTAPHPSHPTPPDPASASSTANAAPGTAGHHEPSMPGRIWASFDSAPVTIISKPSKKTAKTRNISSCILAGGPVSLFNRINSQTVRTKYMTIEHAQLCASNLSWSAFNVNVIRRPHEMLMSPNQALQSPSDSHLPLPSPLPVAYGCEIQLVDTLTGIATSPLIIRKVDKGKVASEEGGPVSQMQKIALQRVNLDGSRSYLSAASPTSTTSVGSGAASPGPPPPTPGSAGQPASHPLIFQSPRVRDEVRDGVRVISDEVDDYLCWTIVGISKFQYTFFDGAGANTPIPRLPITPFPTLFTAPGYRVATHTIELTVSNFFYTHPETLQHTPLEVWLGPIGPLRQRIFQATPPGPLTSIGGMNGLPSPLGVGHGMGVPLPGHRMTPALNGLPPPSANNFASLNGMNVPMGVGGMMNMGMGYGQPSQPQGGGGGADGSSEGSNAAGGVQGQSQVQVSPSSSSQPPTPSTAGPLPSSDSNPASIVVGPLQGNAAPSPVASTSSSTMPPPHSPPVAPPRFIPQGPLHTIIIVDLPSVAQIVRSARESVGLPSHAGYLGESVPGVPGLEMGINLGPSHAGETMGMGMGGLGGDRQHLHGHEHEHPAPIPPPLPTLPILFIRTYDGIGYHSGRSIACEPNLSPDQVERIRRGGFNVGSGLGGSSGVTGNGNGNESGSSSLTTNSGANATRNGPAKEDGANTTRISPSSNGLLDGDIDWMVRVL